jgi:hypothetical protein
MGDAGPVAGRRTERVRTGLDVLVEQRFAPLRGRAVGLVCNPTSVDRRLRHVSDLLHEARGVRLAALFGPEHGVRGDIQYMAAARGGHVLDVPPDAVFRAEEGGKPDAPRLVEQVRDMPQAPVHRRGVADQPHGTPPQGGEALLDEHVEAGPDPLRATPGDRACVSHKR